MHTPYNLKQILDKYNNSTFGIYGEDFERRNNPEMFKLFKHDVEHNIPWVNIEDILIKILPQIGYSIAEIGFDSLSSIPTSTVWGWSSSFKDGHEHQSNFEDKASVKIQEIIANEIPFLSFIATSQHAPLKNAVESRRTQSNKGLVRIIYDTVDGCTNFLNSMAKLASDTHFSKFNEDLFKGFSVPAGTCISFSHISYPNFPFVTGYISYQNKQVITFLRRKYGDIGISQTINSGSKSILNFPISIKGSGVPKIIIPNYMGESENYGHIGKFSKNLIDYFKRFEIEVRTDGGSRTSAEDLRSLNDNQAMMYIDVRNLLNSRSKLHMSDILAIGTPLNAIGWIMLHTQGNKIEEQRTEKVNINRPIDFLAINPNYFPASLSEPNPLDAVQYARLKLLQDEIMANDINSCIKTVKIGDFRYSKEGYVNENLSNALQDMINFIKENYPNDISLFKDSISVSSYGLYNKLGQDYIAKDSSKAQSFLIDQIHRLKLKVHKQLDSFRDDKSVLDINKISLEELISLHATSCAISDLNDMEYIESEIERMIETKTGYKFRITEPEDREYIEDITLRRNYHLQRQRLAPVFYNKSVFHFKKALFSFDKLYHEIETVLESIEQKQNKNIIPTKTKHNVLNQVKEMLDEKKRSIMPMLYGGNIDDVNSLLFPEYSEMEEENLQNKIIEIFRSNNISSDTIKKRLPCETIKQFNLDKYLAILYSQRAVDYEPLNYHYIKQHAINFMLANRVHGTRMLLEEAIELGHKAGGWYPKDYVNMHLNTFSFVPKEISDRLPSDRRIGHYKAILSNHVEDNVKDLMKLIGEPDDNQIEFLNQEPIDSRIHPIRKYYGLWELMKNNGMISKSFINQARLIVEEKSADDKYAALELMKIHIPEFPIVGFAGSGKSRKVFKAYKGNNREIVSAIILYDDLPTSGCSMRLRKSHGGIENLMKQEEEKLRKITHPNIITVRTTGLTDNIDGSIRGYIEYDYIEGENLDKIMEHPMDKSISEILKYFCQIADALGYLHNNNYIHRDVKLDNILISSEDKAMLVDMQHVSEIENSGTTPGDTYASDRYRNPSIPHTDKANVQTDIFSLATCLYYSALRVQKPTMNNRYRIDKRSSNSNVDQEPNKVITIDEFSEFMNRTLIEFGIDDRIKNIITKGMMIRDANNGLIKQYSSMNEMKQDLNSLYRALEDNPALISPTPSL
jgi:serine/threonine protein kinase